MRNEFMQFKQKDESTTELLIYGDIREVGLFERSFAKQYGEEVDAVSALTFKEALADIKTDNLVVRINSGGGSVSEALAIYNQLLDFPGELITKVDGFAASAASVIFMAGSKRIVPSSGLLMIHNAMSYQRGHLNSQELRKIADDLDKITQPSINIYVEKTRQSEDVIKKLMNEETWITSKESLELGFSTETIEEDENTSHQQNVLISLVNENKRLKQNLSKGSRFDMNDVIKEVIEQITIENKPNQTSHSTWDGFFITEEEK